jgi:hypothetical protein
MRRATFPGQEMCCCLVPPADAREDFRERLLAPFFRGIADPW